VDFPATRRLVAEAIAALPLGRVPVVTGFIGGSASGATTLLGRGGSDYTAAVLGWALDAERVEIWSDVPGVMSGDPRRDAGARTLPRLSYREAMALARAGAKVLHPRTLEPLEPLAIPVFVGRTLDSRGAGTWISVEPVAGTRCPS
jgi:aspartokinase/homoserine dehydrogenase 1